MNHRKMSRAKAVPMTAVRNLSGAAMQGVFIVVALMLLAVSAKAQEKIITSHGYSTFGALKYPADFPHLDYVNADAPKGGEISISAQGNFDSFNQYARDGVPAALNTIGTERVMMSTSDDPYGLYCFLCTSLEYPEDLSWVIFDLRDDVTFQDGTPMTAEDIEFTHKLFLEQGILEYRRLVENFFSSVEVLGPYRIKFSFQPDSSIRDRIGIAGSTPAFSKKWFEETGTRLDKSTKSPFMSTGVYVLDNFDFNRRVVYRRNPGYWGKDIPFNVGRDNFETIRIEYFADAAAEFEGFKAGEYTLRVEDEAQNWAKAYDFPNVTNGYVIREEIPDYTVGQRLSWVFNLDKEKWQDKRVRQAIEMMFNFEWTNRTLHYDLFKRPVSFWQATDLAATGTPGAEELAILQPLVDEGLLEPEILTQEAVIPAVHNASRNRASRQLLLQADALLREAGWITDDAGVRRNKDGEALELVILQTFSKYFRVVAPFLQNLEALGVDARMDKVDTSEYVQRREAGNFDMANQGFQMGFEPSLGLLQWFGSTTADNSSRNLMRLRSPAVDRIVGKVLETKTLDEMKTSVRALDRTLRYLRFDIPLWYNDKSLVAYYEMYSHPETLPPLAVGYLDFWWYDATKAEKLISAGILRR